jgi:adenylylsulfate kinase-like enzyme
MYARARQGLIQHFTGIDDPYEAPLAPELRIDAVSTPPETNARTILSILKSRGYVI